jgi:hypothetical protein
MFRGWRAKSAFLGATAVVLAFPALSPAGQIVYMHGGSPQSLWVMNDNGTDNRALITSQTGISRPSQPSLAPNSTNLAFQATAPSLPGSSGAQACGYNCVGIYSLIGGTVRRVSPPVVSCASDTGNCATKIDNDPSMTTDGHVVYLHAGSLFGLPLCGAYGCTEWGGSSVVFLKQSDVGGDTPKQWQTPSSAEGNYQPQDYPGSNPVSDPGNPDLIAYSGLMDNNCQAASSCDPVTIDNSAGTSAYNVTDADCDFSSPGSCEFSDDMNVLAFSPGGKYILVDFGSQSASPGLWVFQNQQYAYSGGPGGSSSPIYGTGWWVWEPAAGQTIGQGGAITSDTPGQGQIIFTFNGNVTSIPGSCWGDAATFTTGQPVPGMINPTCSTNGTYLTSGGNDNFPTWTSSAANIAVGGAPAPTGTATTTIRKIGAHGTAVSFSLKCSAGTGNCADTVGLTTLETLHGSKVTAVAAKAKAKHESVVLGSARVTLAAGGSKRDKLSLNGAGKKLLSKFHKLPMLAIVLQGGKTVGARKVTVNAPKKKHHHHHHH